MTNTLVIASHRRSGTHWMIDSLRFNALDINPKLLTLEHIEAGHPKHMPVAEFDRRLRAGSGLTLVKTHSLPNLAEWRDDATRDYAANLLASAPALYVHRDGRDVLVSLYHFAASYNPKVAGMAFSDFIRTEKHAAAVAGLSQAGYWQHHVLSWLAKAPAARVAYEGLQADYAATLADAATTLGLRLRPQVSPVKIEHRSRLRSITERVVRKVLGRPPRPRSTAIQPRVGISGGWRANFDDADLAWFETQAREAMTALGYE